MKLRKFLKSFLSLLIISATILSMFACSTVEDNSGSDSSLNSDNADNGDNGDTPFETQAGTAGAEIILSGEQSFRIIYAASYKDQAQKIANKLINLDKNYVKDSDKYAISLYTKLPADGTPEIIIGATNRDASDEAKKLVSGKKDRYAIYVSANAIAIYASAKEGIEEAVDVLIKNFSRKDNAVIYDNSEGNITGKYTVPETEKPQVSPSSKTKTPAKSDVNGDDLLNALKNAAGSKAYSVAVSTTDGIKTAAIRNTDPQNTYSVSKVFCVTAIGMLYDEGKIQTSDTIGNIFKDEIKAYGINENKWKNVTVHDVLKHKAGFKQGGLLDIDADPSLMNKHDDFLKVVLNYELDTSKPYKYTDAAYYLISRVVAKVSGQKLDTYLKSRLFDIAEYKDYRITKCPQGHPIGATQFFLRPEDVVKLGRIYLDGGTYKGKRIISQEWVNIVIDKGYELNPSNNGYGKGGMRGQYLYVNFTHNVAVAWLSETDGGTSGLSSKLRGYMT